LAEVLNQHITAKALLNMIPDDEMVKLIRETGIDYQVKKLYGRNLFYLLLYGLMESSRASLRSLEDVYKSEKFRLLFNLNGQKDVKFNTISSRLNNVNVEFFEKAYELVYSKFSGMLTPQEAFTYKLTRIDSTMVCETANKIEAGMINGSKKNGKKQIKYTISLTDILPSSVEVFTQQVELSEDIAIPRVVLKNIDKRQDNIFVFDRGVQSRERFCEMDKNEIKFITRVREVARHEILRSYSIIEELKVGNLHVQSDEKVFLFGKNKKVEHPFRLIKTINESNEPFWFLTNEFSIPVEEVIQVYKHRWDIELFFRFIKQELNFKHFMSTSINGIKVVLYMTLILAMLILMYKKLNQVGYRTAKRRFYYELDGLILRMVATLSGGDPNLVFR
jgi:hypothetical protein